jgi:hypothetical protein
MKIFQQTPCRLYPQIISSIQKQFPNGLFVHELFSLKDGAKENELEHKLHITDNDAIFPRCDFTYGIFDSKKVEKKKGDFWFTIKIPEHRLLQELFAGLNYFSSPRFRFKHRWHERHFKTHQMYAQLHNLTEEEFVYLVKSKKISDMASDKVYNIRQDIIIDDDYISDGDFDYVGNFDNWHQTIKDIKKLTGLDLEHLSEENPYSYKYENN